MIDTGAKAAATTAPAQAAAPAAAPRRRACAVRSTCRGCARPSAPSALPAARKIMADQGVDAADVTGTGRGGRLTKGDVQAVVEARGDVAKARLHLPHRSGPAAGGQGATGDVAGQSWRAPRATRADVASAPARCRAAGAVAGDRGHPDHVQRSEHGAGARTAQSLQGSLRKGTRRQARLHGVLRQGRGACAEEVSGRQRLDRRHRHRLPRLFRHRHRGRQSARPGRADPARRRHAVDRRDRKADRATSASARRTAS